jgi:branched-chain amino acid aminotransferase
MAVSVKSGKIWHNGRLIPFDDARIHVLSHVVSYGSAVFEGIRFYEGGQGTAVFRLSDHVQRLFNSAKVYRMKIGFTPEQVCEGSLDVIRENQLSAGYLRPIVLRGFGTLGVDPGENPVEVYLACWNWGRYLGSQAQEQGVDTCVSSWARMAPNTLPAMAKSAANYMNSQLVKMEAIANGYVEGIALDSLGHVSEGSGENLFLVRDGRLLTPPLSASVLPGITRDTVLTIAEDLGIEAGEENIPREALYMADELFFTGTAVEITPIRSVDRIVIGTGRRGPITERIQMRFFEIVSGAAPDSRGWLTPVAQAVPAGR